MIARQYRFHGHGSFNYLFKHGHTVRGHLLLIRYIKNEKRPRGRIGVVVSKKVAKSAVIRNRIRRRIFEAVRLRQPQLKSSYDIAFITLNKDLATIENSKLAKDVEAVLKRAHIWHDSRSQTD